MNTKRHYVYLIALFVILISCKENPAPAEVLPALCENEQLFINAPDSFEILNIRNCKSSFDLMDSLSDTRQDFTQYRIEIDYFNKKDSSKTQVYIPFYFNGARDFSLCSRNIFEIRLNSKNQLLVEGEYCSYDSLLVLVKRNIFNYGKNPSFANDPKSAVISFRWEVDSNVETISTVYSTIIDAYLSTAHEESLARFCMSLCKLPKDSVLLLKEKFPIKFWYFKTQIRKSPLLIDSILDDESLLINP